MDELQKRVYQERTAASVFVMVVSNARFRGKESINEAKAAIEDILTPQKGGQTALESALDPDASKTRAYIAVLAENDRGFTLMYNLQRADESSGQETPSNHGLWHSGGKSGRTTTPLMYSSSRRTRKTCSNGSTYPKSW
jgi:hypothetical protein